MTELVTLARSDDRFQSYIEGTFARDKRAIPLKSLNVNTESEQVTFQIIDLAKIEKPFWSFYWLQTLKARNFLFVAFPIFLIFAKSLWHQTLFDPLTAILSSMGAFCLMTALNLRNDYADHLSGLDRIHPQSGSRAIQLGWVTAKSVLNWSYFYLVWGGILGLRALWLYNEVLILLGVFAFLGIVGMSSYKMGFKYRRWSEWTVFWLLGPFLTVGIQLSTGAGFDLESLYLGCLTGWLAVFYVHLKNFEQLLVNDQARFENTITWLGFEKGKRWLLLWWSVFLAVVLVYHHYYSPLMWRLITGVVLLAITVPFAFKLKNLQSSVGSGITEMFEFGKKMIYLVMALWVIEGLWYI